MSLLVALPGGPRAKAGFPKPEDKPLRTRSQLNLVVPAPPRHAIDRGASLAGRDFTDQELNGVDFTGADLTGAQFCGASLVAANFTGATLDGADFFGADLTDARLARANAPRANFGGAQLDDVDAPGLQAPDAVFSRATLNNANFQDANVQRARFQHCDLVAATFHSADATDADFSACTLTGANFDHASLEGALFRTIHRYAACSFYGCDLAVANCTGSALFRRHVGDENYIRELKERSSWSRFGVFVWWARSDCGRSFSRWGAWTAFIALCYAFAYMHVGVNFGANETVLSPIYFSIVTLTSLGYGDVLPTTAAGQIVAMSESLVGFCLIGGLITIFSNKVARRAD